MYDVVVVGAGASGIMAAGMAALRGKRVLLLEKMPKPARKLGITGKGRCNITNIAGIEDFKKHIGPDKDFLNASFSLFFNSHLIEFFDGIGVKTIIERGGRVFPSLLTAPELVRVYIRWLEKTGAELRCDTSVTNLLLTSDVVTGVQCAGGQSIAAGAVIVATGGKSYPATGSTGDGYQMAAACGHQIVPLRPALVPLRCSENYISRLKGLRLKNVRVKAEFGGNVIADLFGELEFTGNGISGPLVLTLSRMAGNVILTGSRMRVIIDLKPALSEQKLEARLLRDLSEKKHQGFSSLLRGLLPAQLTGVFCNLLNIPESYSNAAIDASQRKSIIALLKAMPLSISGTGDYKEAVITAGGVKTSQVNPITMESKIIKNLYFTGEVLDLDADTGGYNLQIAFSTGFVAGNAV